MTANRMREQETNQARAQDAQGAPPSASAMADRERDLLPIPDDAIILVPVRNIVLFPGVVVPLSLGRVRTIAAAQEAARTQRPLGVILQRDPADEDPAPEQLHAVGTVAGIMRYVTAPDGAHHIVVQGQQRFRTLEYLAGYPFLVARIERIEEPETMSPEVEARLLHLKERTLEALQYLPQAPRELANAIQAIPTPDGRRRPGRELHGPQGRGEAGDPRDHRRQGAARQGAAAAEPRDRGPAPDPRHQRADQGERRQPPARVHPARADEDDPEGARRGGRDRRRDRRARRGDHQGPDARGGRGAGAQGAQAARADARGRGRALHGAHLSRLADRAALVGAERGLRSTSPRRAACSTTSTTASPRSSGASSSTWRCASSTRRARARSCASSARPASARPRSARASRMPPGASSCARAWAACTTRPRSAATAAPISAPCRATSSSPSARPARATRCSCSTRWTSSAPASTATRRRRCSRFWIPSRTRPSATTTWACRST